MGDGLIDLKRDVNLKVPCSIYHTIPSWGFQGALWIENGFSLTKGRDITTSLINK